MLRPPPALRQAEDMLAGPHDHSPVYLPYHLNQAICSLAPYLIALLSAGLSCHARTCAVPVLCADNEQPPVGGKRRRWRSSTDKPLEAPPSLTTGGGRQEMAGTVSSKSLQVR